MGGVIISPNPKKESKFIDVDGNEVVPFTKQVIKVNTDTNTDEKKNDELIETNEKKNDELIETNKHDI